MSQYNKGATDIIRDTHFKDNISLKHQGRIFNKSTLDMHKHNMSGKSLSSETRLKMSQSHGGVTVYIKNCLCNEMTVFNTKTAASLALCISIRTLDR